MGKSPAKWIKTKLFGKKSSGSAAAKERGTVKLENDNDVRMVEHREKNKSAMEHSSVLQPTAVDVDVGENLDSMDGGQSSYISAATDTSNPVGQAGVYELKEVQAATKVQAALRGYLARRAFQALRGIIRLQAMIRGHLVRKQAIATLQCMQGIVKMQAIVRGNRVRCSDIGLAVGKFRNQEKPVDIKSLRSSSINGSPGVNRLSANAFVQQLLAPACTASALRFHYSGNEPNSAVNWLERWMFVRAWEPSPLINKSLSELDLQENQSNGHHLINYAEYGRLKRSTRRFTSTNVNLSSAGNMIPNDEKSRRNLKKLSSSATVDHVDEHQLSELEKVKRSLRKVSASMTDTTSSVPDVLPELSKKNLKIAYSSAADVPNQSMDGHEDNVKKASVGIDILDFEESALKPVATNVIDTSIQEKSPSTVVLSSLKENAEVIDVSVPNGGIHGKERHMTQENQKTEKKRSSLSAKLDENGEPVTPTLPRYMAATESAKAKLQAHGSPSSVSDISDKNIITRRHSLPSAANGKASSPSLPAERQFQTSGKSVGKNDRFLLSSRDGNEKVIREWRR